MALQVIISDEVLVERFKNGCMLSYEELIQRYESKAHNLAMRLTRNPEDAEEVLQDVFLTVYRKIEGFEGKSKFSSWLYRITVNASFMKLRKNKNKRDVSFEDMSPFAQNKAINEHYSFGDRADHLAVNEEIRLSLEQAISKLPEEYRAVFVLRDIDGLSNKEVGDILGLTTPAVKSRLHRSRIMLRKKLQRFYEDYTHETKILGVGPKMLRKAA